MLHSVTELYIEHYPLKKQMEYNSKLLNLEPKATVSDIANMSEEEKTAMLIKLLAK